MRSEASLATYPLITGIALRVAPQTGVLLGTPPGTTPRAWPDLGSWATCGSSA